MNRRTFAQALGAAALGAAVPTVPASATAAASSTKLPPYNLSVMLWTVFTDLPLEQRLEKIAEAGYNQVELVGEYNAKKWTPADFESANAAARRLKIKFDATAGLVNGITDPATRDAFLAELRQALVPMETLGCPAMIVLSGNVVPGMPREMQHEACVETLKQAARMIENRKIDGQPVRLLLECIHLEEMPKYFLTSAAEAIEVVRAVNHPQVQFLYDFYHEQMSFGNLIQKLENNIDIIGLVHVADVPGRHEPGSGEINYGSIFRKLAELNYKHTIAMEFMSIGDTLTALRKAKALALSAGAV
jgi:hydroxypyruvate isomerase